MSHGGVSHQPLRGTLKTLKRHWAVDLRDLGCVSAYVKALYKHCGCLSVSKATPTDMLGMCVVKYNKTTSIEVIKVESLKLDDALTEIQTKYHTRLRKQVHPIVVMFQEVHPMCTICQHTQMS